MLHALALLVISGHPRLVNKRFAAGSIALGSALFSGSIYGLILAKMKNINVGKVLGPITPIGGRNLFEKAYDRLYYACWMDCFDSVDGLVRLGWYG